MTETTEKTPDSTEADQDASLELEVERLNTLLATTENSLREMQNERGRERILREKHEGEIVLLKGDIGRVEREKEALEADIVHLSGEAAQERERKQQAVAVADRLRTEAATLRRAGVALEAQMRAAGNAMTDAAKAKSND